MNHRRSSQRNITRYINYLRRRIQILQAQSTEMTQTMNMLLVDQNILMDETHNLQALQRQLDYQNRLQDALNFSLEEEIRQLRELTGQQLPQPLLPSSLLPVQTPSPPPPSLPSGVQNLEGPQALIPNGGADEDFKPVEPKAKE
ncbi:hypothetical protein JRO89_XSUnG0015000 [Xanthoceras sorbifolium]|uniref:Uncharacterized protein n=1 Tax=Xanthoceras sorbifolium TaxID=99658 RepID=A0ABQ8H0A6_9ROSI|nr:hypothetical protein JRO89_XSUnG0015000 [Xanthoceras sorbifolium]